MNSTTFNITTGQKSLRLACDVCHQGKVKCSGGTPCEGCRRLGVRCKYSTSNRTGRPKGVKNKKTLERIKQLRDDDTKDYEKSAVGDDRASSGPAKRQSSASQSQPKSQADQIYLSTSASSPKDSHNSADSNFTPIAGNIPDSSWGCFPVSQPQNFLETDHAPSITTAEGAFSCHISGDQGPCTSHDQPFDYLGLLDTDNTPGCMLTELCGGDTLFTATDLSPTGSVDMDYALSSLQAPNKDSSAIQNSEPAGLHITESQIRPPSACNCVRQITEKLASCKAISVYSQRFQPDLVLTVARDTLMGWQIYLRCPSCQQSSDKDVLVLSVMAFRALLNLIQQIGLGSQYPPQCEDTDDTTPMQNSSSVHFLDSQNSFLGAYRLAREEKRLVVDLLLHRALRSLDHIAKSLIEKSSNMAVSPFKADNKSNQYVQLDSSPFSSGTSPNTYNDLLDVLEGSDRADMFNSTGFSVSLDEHDNYLQGSLKSLLARIESLLSTIQNPQTCSTQLDEDMLDF